MGTRLRVRAASAERRSEYDLFVAAVGYEARARYVVQTYKPQASLRLGLEFLHDRVLDFDRNCKALLDAGYALVDWDDESLGEKLFETITEIEASGGPIRIGVDISSLTRKRIAIIFDALRRASGETGQSLSTRWHYSVARFASPPREFVPNVIAQPVLPSFAGWTIEPDQPLVAMVGLGYEEDRALGAVEHVQAFQTYALRPISLDGRYDLALTRANARFMEAIRPRRVLEYRVDQPLECFGVLESLAYGLLKTGNALILPFGPKIFALCSMLVAHLHPEIAVWRVSAGRGDRPVNRRPCGQVACLSVEFAPAADAVESDPSRFDP